MRTDRTLNGGVARDRGASVVEYGALLMVGALIIGVLAMTASGTVEPKVRSAICGMFNAGCQAPAAPPTTGQTTGTPPSTQGGAPPTKSTVQQQPTPSPSPTRQPSDQEETEAVLGETQLGRDALRWVRENGVRVVYRAGGGSYYSSGENTFYIDTNQSPEERANTFVHEVNHAQSPDFPDADDMEKDEFVRRSIDEETEGTVEAILNNQQLQRARGPGQVPDTLLQGEYQDAYDKAIRDENAARARNQRPPLTPEQERELGQRAGTDRVRQAFQNGEVITSTDQKPYSDYYGDQWEDANDCFLWIFC
ncbi:hypothetical protein [Spirillospora sp. NPDC047279]|uniref:hypothetical protein n=1 Tax=Spirillospora sp. NPDC047279 TaxID=3155478 RepID=UPI0033EDCAF8